RPEDAQPEREFDSYPLYNRAGRQRTRNRSRGESTVHEPEKIFAIAAFHQVKIVGEHEDKLSQVKKRGRADEGPEVSCQIGCTQAPQACVPECRREHTRVM